MYCMYKWVLRQYNTTSNNFEEIISIICLRALAIELFGFFDFAYILFYLTIASHFKYIRIGSFQSDDIICQYINVKNIHVTQNLESTRWG